VFRSWNLPSAGAESIVKGNTVVGVKTILCGVVFGNVVIDLDRVGACRGQGWRVLGYGDGMRVGLEVCGEGATVIVMIGVAEAVIVEAVMLAVFHR
jgi:hypothetical protein